jgi:NADH-quinone oxidoreductase subunit N
LDLIPAPEINLHSLAPALILSVFAMGALVADLYIGRKKIFLAALSIVGLVVTALSTLSFPELPIHAFNDSYVVDRFSLFATLIFTISSALAVLLSVRYNEQENIKVGEYYALILFATVGMIVLASSIDLIMIFLGIEIISISLYVLAGIRRTDHRSNEAALKYFLLGSFATGFLLYGMALMYGATGTTKMPEIARILAGGGHAENPLLLMGVVLLIVGFGFKVAAVPFHMWAPDVYQGAPTPITAFMAVGPKAAVFVAIFRVFADGIPVADGNWETLLAIIAVITMFVGNLGALFQTNIKRLLAYSSVSHAGYILIGVIAKNSLGFSGILFYMLAYTFMTFGVFGIVVLLGRAGNENLEIESYSGLGYKHPLIAMSMAIFMLSLGGMPPFAGFVAKFYIFSAAIKAGHIVLVVLAVLNSAISLYYYLKIIVFMYMKDPVGEFKPSLSPYTLLVIVLGIAATIQLGIFPGPFIESLAQN